MAWVRAEIRNYAKLQDKFKLLKTRFEVKSNKFSVTFTAPYAVYVHEKIEMVWRGKPRKSGIGVYWGPAGEAKYLENAVRRLRNTGTLAKIIKDAVRRKMTVLQGMRKMAERILFEASMHVPVEYGVLKKSGKIIQRKS